MTIEGESSADTLQPSLSDRFKKRCAIALWRALCLRTRFNWRLFVALRSRRRRRLLRISLNTWRIQSSQAQKCAADCALNDIISQRNAQRRAIKCFKNNVDKKKCFKVLDVTAKDLYRWRLSRKSLSRWMLAIEHHQTMCSTSRKAHRVFLLRRCILIFRRRIRAHHLTMILAQIIPSICRYNAWRALRNNVVTSKRMMMMSNHVKHLTKYHHMTYVFNLWRRALTLHIKQRNFSQYFIRRRKHQILVNAMFIWLTKYREHRVELARIAHVKAEQHHECKQLKQALVMMRKNSSCRKQHRVNFTISIHHWYTMCLRMSLRILQKYSQQRKYLRQRNIHASAFAVKSHQRISFFQWRNNSIAQRQENSYKIKAHSVWCRTRLHRGLKALQYHVEAAQIKSRFHAQCVLFRMLCAVRRWQRFTDKKITHTIMNRCAKRHRFFHHLRSLFSWRALMIQRKQQQIHILFQVQCFRMRRIFHVWHQLFNSKVFHRRRIFTTSFNQWRIFTSVSLKEHYTMMMKKHQCSLMSWQKLRKKRSMIHMWLKLTHNSQILKQQKLRRAIQIWKKFVVFFRSKRMHHFNALHQWSVTLQRKIWYTWQIFRHRQRQIAALKSVISSQLFRVKFSAIRSLTQHAFEEKTKRIAEHRYRVTVRIAQQWRENARHRLRHTAIRCETTTSSVYSCRRRPSPRMFSLDDCGRLRAKNSINENTFIHRFHCDEFVDTNIVQDEKKNFFTRQKNFIDVSLDDIELRLRHFHRLYRQYAHHRRQRDKFTRNIEHNKNDVLSCVQFQVYNELCEQYERYRQRNIPQLKKLMKTIDLLR